MIYKTHNLGELRKENIGQGSNSFWLGRHKERPWWVDFCGYERQRRKNTGHL